MFLELGNRRIHCPFFSIDRAIAEIFDALWQIHPCRARIAKRNVVNLFGFEHRGPRYKLLRRLIVATIVQFNYNNRTVIPSKNIDRFLA